MDGEPSHIRGIFVVGHARCGTTLINKIIQAHPSIAGGNETRLFTHFREMLAYSEQKKRTSGIYAFHRDHHVIYRLIKQFATDYYHAFARERNAAVFVEKTPSHALSLEMIYYCFPDAHIVFCLRDGRDVWLSHKELARHNARWRAVPQILEEVATTWSEAVEVATTQTIFPRAQFHVVRYEELIANPIPNIRSLYEACNVAVAVPENELDAIVTSNENTTFYPDYTTGFPGRWKTLMSIAEQHAFNDVAGAALIAAGYEQHADWVDSGVDSSADTEQ